MLPVVLVASLLVASCGSSTPSPSASAAAPSVASSVPAASPTPSASAAPSAPASTAPSPAPSTAATSCDPNDTATPPPPHSDPNDPNAATYTQIERQVSQLRGLQVKTPVARATFDHAGLCAFFRANFRKDNPESLVKGTEQLYKGLLLMPQQDDLESLYLDLLTSQVIGLYDPDTKTMYVVTETGKIGPMEEITYAHEYTHALQDQAFNLKKVQGTATDQSDRSIARSSLIEGDATLLMSLWAQQNLTPQELFQAAGAEDPAAAAALQRIPPILRDTLQFPYTSGLQLTLGTFQQGGYGAVDDLFRDPPDSTEQVMHADKLASREAPIRVSFPKDLAKRLGDGWSEAIQDTLGELQLGILLRETAGVDQATADQAAAGWGGDRVVAVSGPDGADGIVIDTRWDTDQDATEFNAAISGAIAKLQAAGRSAAVLMPSSDRVVLVTGNSDDTVRRLANALGLAG
jgi:hypothetical protein